jgi:hypothetical protein
MALAAHAALLWPGGHSGHGGGRHAPDAVAVQVRLQTERVSNEVRDAAPVAAAVAEQAPQAETRPLPPTPAAAGDDAGAADNVAPSFASAPPDIGFPDAPLPPEGAWVRAWVKLNADGTPAEVITSSVANNLPAAFQKVTERGLTQSQFNVTPGNLSYCLLVRFEPEHAMPQLAWLQGGAVSTARCLTGPMPAPQALAASQP